MRIYTRRGDDGSTGLLFGGRVAKDSAAIEAVGAVDEAQAALGLARSMAPRGSELDTLAVRLERDLWVLMAEVSAGPTHRDRLVDGRTRVTAEMVASLEPIIDDLTSRLSLPEEFVVPGQTPVAAFLDAARTVVRRAERAVVALGLEGSHAAAYLNRAGDLVWTMARGQEDEALPARDPGPQGGSQAQ